MDGRDTGVALTDFAQNLCRKNAEVPDIYFTLLDAADITRGLVLNQMPRKKTEETGCLSNYERRKLQKLYSQGGAAYGSVQNLVKASKVPISEVRHFLYSKTSYPRFSQSTRNFRRMKAFARLGNEGWCMDLTFVEKLVRDNNGFKCLLLRQDMFERTMDGRGMKTKDSNETLITFSKILTGRDRSENMGTSRN